MTSRRDSTAVTRLREELNKAGITPVPSARAIEDWTNKGLAPAVKEPLDVEVLSYYADLIPEMGKGKSKVGVLLTMAFRGYGQLIEEQITAKVRNSATGELEARSGRQLFNADFAAFYVEPTGRLRQAGAMPGMALPIDVEEAIQEELDYMNLTVAATFHQTQVPRLKALKAESNSTELTSTDGSFQYDPAWTALERATLFARGYSLSEIPGALEEGTFSVFNDVIIEIYRRASGTDIATRPGTTSVSVADATELRESVGRINKNLTLNVVEDPSTDIFDLVYAARIRLPFVIKDTPRQFASKMTMGDFEREAMLSGAEWWSVLPTPRWAQMAEMSIEIADLFELPVYSRGSYGVSPKSWQR